MYKRILSLICLGTAVLYTNAQTDWGKTDHKGEPWTRNISRPYEIDRGLEGRHISLWASHGRYYDNTKGYWKWQRPSLFCTTEDLYTQTIVVPYLIPMLENAGAVVFTPRERDWQRNELIVDNDNSLYNYQEHSIRHAWTNAPGRGFAFHKGNYRDNENPFTAGTARMAEATKSKSKLSTVSYQPQIPEEGRYAVYVSYQTLANSVDDAHYTVYHKGQKTEFLVNQQMGGSTWVYLGTFDFDAGFGEGNRVVLSNLSSSKGYVTADAVRFGGGMGNIERGGTTSGLPRCLEGARYAAQWAGMPYNIYGRKNGTADYTDDINVRSYMTNEMLGGSAFAPDSTGRKVPIELSLAVHSDAGTTDTGEGVFGSLTICTTQQGPSRLGAGISRNASLELATDLLYNTTADLKYQYGDWTLRKLYDRNYSETRLPVVPSAILETLSHQNFGDMRYGQDPNFRFTLARSIYKTLLRYMTSRHDEKYVVQPLAPVNFHVEFTRKEGVAQLSWRGLIDGQEESSKPTGYVLYMAQEDGGFDNGTALKGTSCTLKLQPNVLYHFRVTATNDGGQSFPTEVLSAMYCPKATHNVMIVNGFNRLSSPAISDNGQGFDMEKDPGVSYGRTAGWLGYQRVFDTSRLGQEGIDGLGYSTNELQGMFIAGNDFDYVRTHADAIRKAGLYNIASSSSMAVENGSVNLANYQVTDLILGLEQDDRHSLVPYKTFKAGMQNALRNFVKKGGNLLVSGAYVGSDMSDFGEKMFLSEILKTVQAGTHRNSGSIRGMGTKFDFYNSLNERHYAAVQTDVLMPTVANAFPAMAYDMEGTSAAVAYNGQDYHAFTMGFPFECITNKTKRESIMKGILTFLNNK